MAFPTSPTNGQTYTTGGVTYIYNTASGAWLIQTYGTIDAATAIQQIKTVDGSSSGLDADLLDGLSSANFVRADTSSTIVGTLTIAPSNTSGVQDGLILYDAGGGASEGLRIQFRSVSDTNTAYIGSSSYDNLLFGTNGSTRLTLDAAGDLTLNTGNFITCPNTITSSKTIASGTNAMTPGPVTIANGVTVTIADGGAWAIV